MSFKDDYNLALDALKTAVSARSEVKMVLVGEVGRLTSLPAAILDPLDMTFEESAISPHWDVKAEVDIVIIIRESAPANWETDMMTALGAMVDAVLQDRSLGGKVFDARVQSVTPSRIQIPRDNKNRLYYGGVARVQVWFKHSA